LAAHAGAAAHKPAGNRSARHNGDAAAARLQVIENKRLFGKLLDKKNPQ
jgi:hypothetical protein